jgi:hypothetical protein
MSLRDDLIAALLAASDDEDITIICGTGSCDNCGTGARRATDAVLILLQKTPLSDIVQALGYGWVAFDIADHPGGSAVATLKWGVPPGQRKVLLVDTGEQR